MSTLPTRLRILAGVSLPHASVLDSLKALLESQSIAYALIGGMAVAIHGTARDTSDVDALVDKLPDPTLLRDPREMEKFGFYPGKSSTGTVLTLDHRRDGQAELLTAKSPIEKAVLASAQPQRLLGTTLPVISAAGLVANKLCVAAENSKRAPKDLADVQSVLRATPLTRNDFDDFEPYMGDEVLGLLHKLVP